jgi:NTE family protein
MSARVTAAATLGDSMPPRAGGLLRLLAAAMLLAVATMQGGCGTSIRNGPINAALAEGGSEPSGGLDVPGGNFEDTVVGLSFSGGGTRAAAFSYGVLRELARTQIVSEGRRSPLIDQVDLVSSVSGGSVTAAYYALKGNAILEDFEQKFLLKDAESSLRTSVSLSNPTVAASTTQPGCKPGWTSIFSTMRPIATYSNARGLSCG